MNTTSASTLLADALSILQHNDKGSYTVPTDGLYPFQWNWDSCLTALAQQTVDANRAWVELETLMAHQWDDGMVPHIVFHQPDDRYFPGPQVWGTNRPTPTSGITQPPVLGLVLEQLWQRSDKSAATQARCLALMQGAQRWHEWFYRCRDPQGTGLVALLHPWESGRDNSTDWDEALARVSTEGVAPFVRRDTQHVDASQRPTQEEYMRYIALVQAGKALHWDNALLHDASAFKVVDPGFNAILIRSDQALAALATDMDQPVMAALARMRMAKAMLALPSLWSDARGQYLCFDRVSNRLVDSPSVGGLLPLLVLQPDSDHAPHLCARLQSWLQAAPFGVASMDPADARFNPLRYWRGPSWLIVNYLLIKGLRSAGQAGLADNVLRTSLTMIEKSGCAEYYNPLNADPLGGKHFTWTAAMVVEFLRHRVAA